MNRALLIGDEPLIRDLDADCFGDLSGAAVTCAALASRAHE
jgi:hypothetical protein